MSGKTTDGQIDQLVKAFKAAFAKRGPHLIELVM